MKILAIVFGALALAGSAQAAEVEAYGWALRADGSRCGSDCTAFMQWKNLATGSGGTKSGPVSSSSSTCLTVAYNWGQGASSECTDFNPGMAISISYTYVDVWMWIRKPCPTGGGFYYSPTRYQQVYAPPNGFVAPWAQTQRLVDPGAGCFAGLAVPTDAGLKTALYG